MMRSLMVCGVLVMVAMLFLPNAAVSNPDPCLMVYPDAAVFYHYDPAEYYTVTFGDPLYDAAYDRGGEVLIEVGTNVIGLDVYQAPGLAGFVEDAELQGYFTMEHDFTLVVDGFSNVPTTFTNVLLVFDMIEPDGCVPIITIDGNPPLFDSGLGWYYPIGDLAVSTPAQGNNYSDVLTFDFSWTGCTNIRIWAFSDSDFDLNRDGNECFSAFSHDLTVPAEEKSWGEIKSQFVK